MVWENILKDDSPLNRSMTLLQSMASEFGIRIKINSPQSVEFKYRGLNYTMNPDGLYIQVGARYIYVCILDERNLPFGDYCASLMGLIVNDPSRIPTLDFGIKLAYILISYGRHMGYETIYLFTPFNSENEDNNSFKELIYALKRGVGGNYTLAGIERALVESFGDDRGFF